MAIKGVLFDFDGTLTQAGSLDFASLRSAIGCPKAQPILEFIESLSSEESREKARRILDEFETEAARRSFPNDGAEELIAFLRSEGLKLGIVTRNSAKAVRLSLENFARVRASDFDVILTRDHELLPKPNPEAVLEAAKKLGLRVEQTLMVGDFTFDVEAGHAAGARTVFLTNGTGAAPGTIAPDFTIGRLPELREVLEMLAPLPMGKLPNRFLHRLLGDVEPDDPCLIVKPGVGEDAAAVALNGEEVLVLKSDPITFTADQAGTYAVLVNVNDIAVSGAVPRWLTASMLFPPGSTVAEIEQAVLELSRTARSCGLTLSGGHTEITDAVTRPVIAANVVGTVARAGLIRKQNMRKGDCLLITKAIAIEGTCILARDLSGMLLQLGVGPGDIDKCRQLLERPGISIVDEAHLAARSGKVTAMHDVTEGGLATALEELSVAGKHRMRVFIEKLPIMPETARFCALLGVNPLGLIASGSLLITCEAEAHEEIEKAISDAGIPVTMIGEVLEEGEGVEARNAGGEIEPWPQFAADELARILQSAKSA